MAPYIKQIVGHIHRSHPPTNSLSLISHVSLSLLKTSTLSLRDLVMAPAFFNGIDMLSSPYLSIFIWSIFIFMFHCILHLYIFLFLAFDLYLIMLPHFTWKNFFVHIFYVHIFSHFIDQVVWTTDIPHHKNQVFTLAMSHSLLMWPFHGSLFQLLLYEIFSNIFCFLMLTNKCN